MCSPASKTTRRIPNTTQMSQVLPGRLLALQSAGKRRQVRIYLGTRLGMEPICPNVIMYKQVCVSGSLAIFSNSSSSIRLNTHVQTHRLPTNTTPPQIELLSRGPWQTFRTCSRHSASAGGAPQMQLAAALCLENARLRRIRGFCPSTPLVVALDAPPAQCPHATIIL